MRVKEIIFTLPNGKIQTGSNSKHLQTKKSKAVHMMKFLLDMIENIVGKGENAGYQHFLLFPQCFQKPFFFNVVKSWDYVIKGKGRMLRIRFR